MYIYKPIKKKEKKKKTNIWCKLILLASISVTNTLRHWKILLWILPSSKYATASLTVSSIRCFFINELRRSLNVKCDSIRAKVFSFFTSLLIFFITLFLHAFIVFNTLLFKIFMLFRYFTSLFYYIISTYVNFYLHFAW